MSKDASILHTDEDQCFDILNWVSSNIQVSLSLTNNWFKDPRTCPSNRAKWRIIIEAQTVNGSLYGSTTRFIFV